MGASATLKVPIVVSCARCGRPAQLRCVVCGRTACRECLDEDERICQDCVAAEKKGGRSITGHPPSRKARNSST